MRILAISKKVLIELLRDKRSLALLFLAPVIIMWLMNVAFTVSTETKVTFAAVDVPQTLSASLDKLDNISLKTYENKSTAIKALKDEKADAVLVYKDKEHYEVAYANTDPSKTSLSRQILKSTIKQNQIQDLIKQLQKAQQTAARPPQAGNSRQAPQTQPIKPADNLQDQVKLSEKYIYGDKDTTFFTKMTPILMGFFVFFFVFLISGMALLKERTSGTLDRLLATPVKRSDIVFGYMLSYGLIAAIQTTVIVLSTIWLLDLQVAGSIPHVILINILFALVALSFGILLSTLASSEFQMMQFIPLVIVPQLFFSGVIPLDTMADWVQTAGKILPLYYAGHALSKVVLHGTSILSLKGDLLALLLFLLVLTILNIIGLKRYRKV
ncbi:ABC transporter permease [Streptococcus caviae]|uniref:ABC transporter permease n=1 Tax=Streptococcus sp. 'caviae' TaxID=1915004 RepID=UPI00094BAFC7|nr:ABC transporter permease [Streptococcus sp. 'caviae']OLN82448.1 antibiotic ABC transporter permease [Streptococcus sp. 'caviae']